MNLFNRILGRQKKGAKSATKESLGDQMIGGRSVDRDREDFLRMLTSINNDPWAKMKILDSKQQARIVQWLTHCSEHENPFLTRITECVDPVFEAVRYSDGCDAVIAALLAYARVRENPERERLSAVTILRRLSDKRALSALRSLSKETGPVGVYASESAESLQWLEPNTVDLTTTDSSKEMELLFQRASGIDAPFEKVNTKNPSEAVDVFIDKAILHVPEITEEQVDNYSYSVRVAWGTKSFVKGAPSHIKQVVLKNLTRYASRSDFVHFSVEVSPDGKSAQISAFFQNSFIGVRVWRTRNSLFACGNADFIPEMKGGVQ